MSPEIGAAPAEVMSFPPEWRWLSTESIQELRDAQLRELHSRGEVPPEFPRSRDTMSTEEKKAYDDAKYKNYLDCREYVEQYIDPVNNPEEVTSFAGLIYQYGIYHVSNFAWQQQEDGPRKYHYANAARHLIDVHADKIVPFDESESHAAQLTSTTEETVTHPEGLGDARLLYASLRLERRRHLHNKGKKRADLIRQYDNAAATYMQQHLAVATEKITALQEAGQTESEIKAEAMKLAITELHDLAKVEMELLNGDTSRRARIARFLAKSNRRFFASTVIAGAAGGAVARLGVGKIAGATAGSVAAIGTGAALGIGMAIGTTRAALTSLVGLRTTQITEHAKRHEQDTDLLYDFHKEYARDDQTPDQYANVMFHVMHGIADRRVEKDQSHNRKRVARAAIAGAIGGTAAVALIEFIGDSSADAVTSGHEAPSVNVPDPSDTQEVAPAPEVEPSAEVAPEFDAHVTVEATHGYTNELQDLAAQQDITLSDQESYELYQHMAEKLDGNFFTGSGESYVMADGDYGIAQAGSATWNAAAMEEFQRWMIENEKIKD